MRLEEALQIAGQTGGSHERRVQLLCGFTPLHFQSYVKAYLRLRFRADAIRIHLGLYGDLEGNLQRAMAQVTDGTIVALEWADLDPRLGFRGSGGWRKQTIDDIIAQATEKCDRLEERLVLLAHKAPLLLISPTLPLPPMAHCVPAQASKCELGLNVILSDFLSRISKCTDIRLLSASQLASESPAHLRYDIKMDIATGFPYSLPHADTLARLGVSCLFPSEPKKGLITDLDQTLWKGILGDAGVDGVSWSVEEKSHIHALYQQLLDSLAESGVLLAIASKNDVSMVDVALQRKDLLVRSEAIYPVEVGWGPKSEAVSRILKVWNIGAESAVFVDDSPMEISEVSERFPQIKCLQFPSSDANGVLTLIIRLRELFGRTEIREEDRLRVKSLRSAVQFQTDSPEANPEEFIARLHARVTFDSVGANEKRAFELVNKTNQFNLNGVRFTEAEWRERHKYPGSFLTMVSYEDRFGPLGRIAVLGGYFREGHCVVDIFVISCRAFSRLIEFQILRHLFEKTGIDKVLLLFKPTQRNGPLQSFLGHFNTPTDDPSDEIEISAATFATACPKLNHEVIET